MPKATALAIALLAAGAAQAAPTCLDRSSVAIGSGTRIEADLAQAVRSKDAALKLGFNIDWVGFQDSHWDAAAKSVRKDVLDYLRAMPGLIYRYPGGTLGNYFDWQQAVGDPALRQPQTAVSWTGPVVAKFGIAEYLDFVTTLAGRPWLTLNIYGRYGEERPPESQAAENAELARLVANAGILRFELGNELDRSPYYWSPAKYANAARLSAAAVGSVIGGANFAAVMEDYDANPGTTASAYNRAVASALKPSVREFIQHSYYDGKPGGPPISNRVRQICAALDDGRKAQGTTTSVWVTEHGRWPAGDPTTPNWKSIWPNTWNLGGTLSTVDFALTMSQIPEIKGSLLHALTSVTAPWHPFQRKAADGTAYPMPVYWGLRLVHRAMDGAATLATRTTSVAETSNPSGYAVRAAVFRNPTTKETRLLAVNRRPAATPLTLVVKGTAAGTVQAARSTLANADLAASNDDVNTTRVAPVEDTATLRFQSGGVASVTLPANSVTLLRW